MKKMLACALAICMAVSMASCSDSDSSSKKDKNESSSSSSAADKQDKTDAADAEAAGNTTSAPEESTPEETTTTAEPEPKEDGTKYAYYDDLAAEYEKSGNTTCYGAKQSYSGTAYGNDLRTPVVSNGEVYGFNVRKQILWHIDKNGNSNVVAAEVSRDNTPTFCAGYFYYKKDETIHKVGADGKEAGSLKIDTDKYGWGLEIQYVTPAGQVIIGDYSGHYYVADSALKGLKEMPLPDGVSNYADLGFGPAYGSRIFMEKVNYAFDCDSLTYTESSYNTNVGDNGYRVIGKYMLGRNNKGTALGDYIYDLEKDSIVIQGIKIEVNTPFWRSYFGGNYNIDQSSSWRVIRYSTTQGDEELVNTYATVDSEIATPIDDKSYVIVKDDGVYIKPFEGGEEKQALKF